MSHLLTSEVAQRAVGFALPSITHLMDCNVFKRHDLHIVVAKPSLPDGREMEEWCETGILYEHSLGKPTAWEYDYKGIARSKCYESWRWQQPNRLIQVRSPHLLEKGDTLFYGSAYGEHLATACSGIQPFYDEMISWYVWAGCIAGCVKAREALGDGDRGFI